MRKPLLLLALLLLLTASVFTVSRAADPAPPVLSTCDCSAQVLNPQTGQPQKGVKFFVRVHSSVVSGQLVQPATFNTSTDSAGVAHIKVVQGAKVTISGDHPAFATPVTRNWPSTSTCSLVALFGVPLPAAVFGAGTSTDNAIVRWDDVTGAAVQNSVVTVSDAGLISGATISGSAVTSGLTALPASGVAFDAGGSNLTNILTLTTQSPARIGMAHGSNASPVNTDVPTLSFHRFDRTTGVGNGTTSPYFFATTVKDGGTKLAYYNLMSYVSSEDTNVVPRDIVGLVGYAISQTGSTSRPIPLYTEAWLQNNAAGQGASVEFKVFNASGVNSPVATTALPNGFTIGLNLTGAGGKYNTIGINFQGGGTSGFLTGIHFPSTVIAPGGYGIDFAYATFTASGGLGGFPIRLGNEQYMVGYIGGVDRKLIGLASTGLISIDGTSVGVSFGGGIRPGPGGFVSSTGQIYTTASQGLVVVGQTGSSYDMLFANAAGTGTLLRNPTGTTHLQIGLSAGDVIVGGNNGALTTGATTGFLNVSSMPGVPVGVPNAWTGYVPLVYDTADNRLYAYNAGWQNVSTGGGGGGGSVTSVAVSGANGIGVSGSPVTTSGTIALTLGAITPTSINGLTISTTTGTLTISNGKTVSHSATTTFAGTDGKTLTISNSGTLSGGDAFVLSIAAAKTFTVSNSLTLAGTDSTVMTFPTTTATIARTDAAQTFTGLQTFGTILSSTSITSPIHYGGSAAGSSLSLQATSNGGPSGALILMNTNVAGTFPGPVMIGAPAGASLTNEAIHTQSQVALGAGVIRDVYGANGSADIFRQAGGTIASPTKTLTGVSLGSFGFRGYQETTAAFGTGNVVKIDGVAAEDFTSTAQGAYLLFGTTPIGSTARVNRLVIDPNGNVLFSTDNTQSIGLTNATRPSAIFLASPSITQGSGTGITVNDTGSVRRLTYKVTISYTALAAAQLTADSVIAVLPAKTRLVSILADVTTTFTGGAVSAATMVIGKSVGGAEYLASFDAFTTTIRRGLVDADMGTAMTRAAAVQGGDLPSWSATTNVSLRLTTVTAFTNALTAGSVTVYLETVQFQ